MHEGAGFIQFRVQILGLRLPGSESTLRVPVPQSTMCGDYLLMAKSILIGYMDPSR